MVEVPPSVHAKLHQGCTCQDSPVPATATVPVNTEDRLLTTLLEEDRAWLVSIEKKLDQVVAETLDMRVRLINVQKALDRIENRMDNRTTRPIE